MNESLTDGEREETLLSDDPSSPEATAAANLKPSVISDRWNTCTALTRCSSWKVLIFLVQTHMLQKLPVPLLGTVVKDWKLTELKLCCMLVKRRRVPDQEERVPQLLQPRSMPLR